MPLYDARKGVGHSKLESRQASTQGDVFVIRVRDSLLAKRLPAFVAVV
jgi:hypothetical protein